MSIHTTSWKEHWTAAVMVVLAVGVGPTRAETLPEGIAAVAANVKKFLDGNNESAVAVGAFTGPSALGASAGPGLQQLLAEELKKLGIQVQRRAAYEVKGDYLDVVDKSSQQLAVLFKVRIYDRAGAVQVEFEQGINSAGEQALAVLFGVTAPLPAGGKPKERNDKIREFLDKPQAEVAGTRIAAAPNSPYAVELLVAASPAGPFKARAPEVKEGEAFVPIHRGEVYVIRLINNSKHDAAVTLAIDGLNLFAFSEVRNARTAAPKYTHVIVAPGKKADIKGWHVTNEHSNSFQVTEYAKSAAAELNFQSGSGLGTITACFAAAWAKDAPKPVEEPEDPTRSADATGRGPRVEQKYTEVVRKIGVIRATVSVRYTR